jgi:hypothetical protein
MLKPWRRGNAQAIATAQPQAPQTKAEAQRRLVMQMLQEFLPKPEEAKTPMERLQWQTLAATVTPLISQVLNDWDEKRGQETAGIIYDIADRFQDLDEQWDARG